MSTQLSLIVYMCLYSGMLKLNSLFYKVKYCVWKKEKIPILVLKVVVMVYYFGVVVSPNNPNNINMF